MSKTLIINPGSTSTKIAIYDDLQELITTTIHHDPEELKACGSVFGQKDLRKEKIIETLSEANVSLKDLSAISCRGGLVRPIESGVYAVNEHMLEDLHTDFAKTHPCSLGAILGNELAKEYDLPCFIADPGVVDELWPQARLTGLPGVNRKSVFHALNTKSVARECAFKIGKPYEECKMIVTHMGGGITIGAHRYGRVVDVNDGLYGEGSFTPDRTGALPLDKVIELCFDGNHSKQDMLQLITKKGGLSAHLGTNDFRKVESMALSGDANAQSVVEAMGYQIAKQIGAMAAALETEVDAIALTGGLAHSEYLTNIIKRYAGGFAPVYVYPGENEMRALAEGAYRVLTGQEEAKEY